MMDLRKKKRCDGYKRINIPIPMDIHYQLKKHSLDRHMTFSAWALNAVIEKMIDEKKILQARSIKQEKMRLAALQEETQQEDTHQEEE